MTLLPEDIIRIVLAIAVGGMIGAEREFRDKAAGFRTLIFICLGSTLFTMFSMKIGGPADPVRIAANVVSGVGFLGAGAILRDGTRVSGLTTAAMIWLSAALGMGIGGGHLALAITGTLATLLVLVVFPPLENWIDHMRDMRTYEVVCSLSDCKIDELEQLFLESGLKIRARHRTKQGTKMYCQWQAYGSPKKHDKLYEKLFIRADVLELKS